MSKGVRQSKGLAKEMEAILCLERDTYKLVSDMNRFKEQFEQANSSDSVLHNLLKSNGEFRVLYVLLKWCEFRSADRPSGFSDILNNWDNVNFEKIW